MSGSCSYRVLERLAEIGGEWTAVGPTEVRCVKEMARCLGKHLSVYRAGQQAELDMRA